MLHADLSLARRVETAEASLTLACVDAARRAESLPNAVALRVAGGCAVFIAHDSVVNKVIGVGLNEPVTDSDLDAIETLFRRKGAPVQLELCPLADQSLPARLSQRGYVLRGFETALAGRIGETLKGGDLAGDRISVERVSIDDERRWARLLSVGFTVPDGCSAEERALEQAALDHLEAQLLTFCSTDRLECYLAFLDNEPVGGGGMRMAHGVALLFGLTTLASARRRGVQSALLQRLLARACEAGCDLAIASTLPGSVSQRNIERVGLRALYTRAILVKEVGEK